MAVIAVQLTVSADPGRTAAKANVKTISARTPILDIEDSFEREFIPTTRGGADHGTSVGPIEVTSRARTCGAYCMIRLPPEGSDYRALRATSRAFDNSFFDTLFDIPHGLEV